VKRIKDHGAWCARHIVDLREGTEDEEQRIKREDDCPRCGRNLNYYTEREQLWRAAHPGIEDQ
jgi:ribosomal protein L37AE/L43A